MKEVMQEVMKELLDTQVNNTPISSTPSPVYGVISSMNDKSWRAKANKSKKVVTVRKAYKYHPVLG